ncbi:hypothetical protein [Desulfothermobacter acidiphilus]|uniref:hypothetical protein n=1 Tax=Desulfothermobacter acidiphilus TaxID=1938353 RepID=UPI003F8AB59A
MHKFDNFLPSRHTNIISQHHQSFRPQKVGSRIEKLWQYLKENWSGIVTSSAAEHLGAIEGQVQRNVARRMKRLGASWTEAGADRMPGVLLLRGPTGSLRNTLRGLKS